MLDSIIDHYYPVLESVGAAIDKIEDEQVENPIKQSVRDLHQHKRRLTHIRRFVWPLRDVINALLHEETVLMKPGTKVFLRDCYDHTVQLMDLVESYRDVLSGLMEIYLSSVSIRTNEIMRVLTVISSIFIPLTFLVGVYGMNFASEHDGKSCRGTCLSSTARMAMLACSCSCSPSPSSKSSTSKSGDGCESDVLDLGAGFQRSFSRRQR